MREIVCTLCASLGLLGGLASSSTAGEGAAQVDFNRDVRPILSKACYNCHGPDDAHRKAGLRLDLRAEAVKELETGQTAIIPGQPDESELYLRVTSDDPNDRMPPKAAGHALSPEQVETLKRWIAAGAPYARHWSFVKPERPALPAVDDKAWPRNPIDNFVLKKLEQSGLRPTDEADRYALIRRLSLDLRGLPPTPAEVAGFVEDQRADAYALLVDRFLDDAAYGERWARLWLDLARYADSKGLGSDPLRTIWRYRDWVIDAFNRNLPFDQFTIEQLAGDLLENPTLEQRIATAFHRNTLTNTEGGTDDEEFRVAAVKDRIDTTFQVWMGLTMGCAKCHNHKFDPISQAEYYQGYAIFNQTADNDQPDESPTIPAPTADIESQVREVDAQIAAARRELDVPAEQVSAEQWAWEAAARVQLEWTVLEPFRMASDSGAMLTRRDDGAIFVTGEIPDRDVYTISARVRLPGLTALRLETLPDPELPNGGAGRSGKGNFVLSRISATLGEADEAIAGERGEEAVPSVEKLAFAKAIADFSQDKLPISNVLKAEALRDAGWGVSPQMQKPHTAWLIVGPREGALDDAVLTIQIEQRYQQPQLLLGKFRLAVTHSPAPGERVSMPAAILQIVDLPAEQRTDEQRAKLAEHFRAIAPSLKPLRDKLAELNKRRPEIPTVPVLDELPADKRRTTKIMVKGNFLDTGAVVEPAVPASFHTYRANASADRLGLARWLVDPENPLTARVTVNRFWAQLFGTGLVETEEDFGTQGELPSHPELLDWLAVEFLQPTAATPPLRKGGSGGARDSNQASGNRSQGSESSGQFAGVGHAAGENQSAIGNPQSAIEPPPPGPPLQRGGAAEHGWDVKRLLKLIVMSATYRQSAQVTSDRLEKDPRNRLLSRGPRFRLEAEMVRDQALAVSGLLSRKSHGPSVFPPQPAGLWQAAFNGQRTWTTSSGEDKYRRGLYTFWRRTVPYPSMATFDAPSRELCTVRRFRTNTPLQAFVTLNDPAYVEAAQALARRIVSEGGATTESRAAHGLQLCLVRPPTAAQIVHIVQLYDEQLAIYRQNPAAATQLATDPLGPLPTGLDAAELAAWTVAANVLLNLDGVLMK